MEEVAAPSDEFAAEAVAEEEAAGVEEGFALPEEKIAVEETAAFEPAAAARPRAEAAAPKVELPPVVMPSKDELLAIFEKTIRERVSVFLAPLDIKEALLAELMPSLKDSIDKVLWEITPELVEKMLRESLKNSMASLTKEVEKVIWETVPDLAGTMISKEIERIKSEF
jgi:hypothetical protein